MKKELDELIKEAEELSNKLEQKTIKLENKKKSVPSNVFATKQELNTERTGRTKGDNLIMKIVTPLTKNMKLYKDEIKTRQNKIAVGLITTDKNIVGAINEIKAINNEQENNIKKNSNNINAIQKDYLKASEANKQFYEKQNKTDDKLMTNEKTIIGAINEINSNKVNNESFKLFKETTESYQDDINDSLNNKQNKIDNSLQTIKKTIVEAINEINAKSANQNENIVQNENEIIETKKNYLKISDANKKFDEKQNSTDKKLATIDKSIIGAINEIKTNNDNQLSNIKENTNKINTIKTETTNLTNSINAIKEINNSYISNTNHNTNDIKEIKADYFKASEANAKLAEKQNKTDEALATEQKDVVQAINEIKSNNDNLVSSIKKNSTEINTIKTETTNLTNTINEIQKDYLKASDINNTLTSKQDKIDKNLGTTDKSIIGAINELKTTNETQEKNIKENINNIKYIKDKYLQTPDIDGKQDKIDNSLKTDNKTIVGAINELNLNLKYRDLESWKLVGKSRIARIWQYNLKINKKYRISFHWNDPDDTTSKIYKEFIWSGNVISLETYIKKYNEVNVGGFQVLGGLDVLRLIATKSKIQIYNKMGSSSHGRIISLEEWS